MNFLNFQVNNVIKQNKRRRLLTPTPSGGGSSLDPDAQAIIDAIEATDAGAVDASVQTAIENFVVSGKTDGWWNRLTAFYGFYGGTASSNAINWRSPGTYNITWNGSINHGAPLGLYSQGGYGDTGLNPNSIYGTSAHIGAYIESSSTVDQIFAGCSDNNAGALQIGRYLGQIEGCALTWVNSKVSATESGGWAIVNRANNTSHSIYYGAGATAAGTNNRSAQKPNRNLYVLGTNQAGSPSKLLQSIYVSMISVGLSLDTTNRANFHSALSTLRGVIRA